MRFRPNLVLDGVLDGGGYPEHRWAGRRIAVGTVLLRFTGHIRVEMRRAGSTGQDAVRIGILLSSTSDA